LKEVDMNTAKDKAGPVTTVSAQARQESLIEYPSAFPIKVMGLKAPGFAPAMLALAQRFDPSFVAAQMTQRPSAADKYLAITLNITATSREQLDGLYGELSKHPMVKMAL
jgi:uncharacterized protein